MSDKSTDEARFDALLPFYLNKTLDVNDQVWMESHLSTHTHARQQLEFEKVLRDTVQRTQPRRSEAERVEQLMVALQADRKSQKPKVEWMGRWNALGWVQRLVQPIRIPAGAFAAVAVLFVAQSVMLVNEMSRTTQDQAYRGERPDCQTTVSRLRVVFTPEAKHVEIVLLLRKLEISVREGPSETGEFWLSVPAGRSMDEALAMLRTSPLVEEAIASRESRPIPGCAK
jgi:hypothetical protein